ncbi:MAG: hypothetical protein JJT82_06295 [Legionellaceae bacterium]|nr:hypothetical protein [Legionellaceae bacterium]
MQWILLFVLVVVNTASFAQGCVVGGPAKQQRFVCFDGRSLSNEGGQLIWHARRGCFKSTIPCCAYQAGHYGRYANRAQLHRALERCRYHYPFRLGEMQTH